MAVQVIDATPVAVYVKACNACCCLLQFELADLRFVPAKSVDRAGFYLRCGRQAECRHMSWVGSDEPDVVARCRIYSAHREQLEELQR